MRGQSFLNFLREEEGKADRQKMLALSAIVGSSVLAQMMFAGVATAHVCPGEIDCDGGQAHCQEIGCVWQAPCYNGVGTCAHP